MDLASFLITRACQNSMLANYFYWYLSIECEDQTDPAISAKQDTRVKEMYVTVMKMFSMMLTQGNAVWQKRRAFLLRQKVFIDQLVSLVKAVARESGNRKKKTDRLRALLTEPDPVFKINFSNFEPIPFPLDPEICIKGIIPEKYAHVRTMYYRYSYIYELNLILILFILQSKSLQVCAHAVKAYVLDNRQYRIYRYL